MNCYIKYIAKPCIFIFLGLLLFRCENQPINPIGEEEKKLAIFSVINPAVRIQKMYASHTLLYKDNPSGNNELSVSDISGTISGPDGDYKIIMMPYENGQFLSQTDRLDTDFLWGSGNFNYIFDGPPIRFGQKYYLSISSNKYGEVSSETTVPGPFEITEVNIEPEFSTTDLILDVNDWGSNNTNYKPNSFRISWSKSENATGYWLDMTVLEYDIPEELRLDWNGTEYSWPDFEDSTRMLDIAFREFPVYFRDSENNPVRGYLTMDNSFEMPLDDFLELVDFPKDFEYRFEHTYRIMIHIHAVNESLYSYLAHSSFEGEKVGQISIIPDMSNIENGFGVFGSAYTQSVTARLYDYILQSDSPVSQNNMIYWYMKFNDVYTLDQIINDEFSRLLFPDGIGPPVIEGPENNTVLTSDQSVTLSWNAVENVGKYLLVLKPYYLWFKAGNLVYIIDENHFELSWQEIPYRDCQIEWYVKGLSAIDHDWAYVMETSSDKAPLVFSNELATPWSESRIIQTNSGEWTGFEMQEPILLTPENSDVIPTNGTIAWESVEGADGYLVVVSTDENVPVITVTNDTLVSPPFTDHNDCIEGLRGISAFTSGIEYTVQIRALRIKAGALAFTIQEPAGQSLPEIYSRYQHPSGIILQSQWSDPVQFKVQ